jgi:hypothetical protein
LLAVAADKMVVKLVELVIQVVMGESPQFITPRVTQVLQEDLAALVTPEDLRDLLVVPVEELAAPAHATVQVAEAAVDSGEAVEPEQQVLEALALPVATAAVAAVAVVALVVTPTEEILAAEVGEAIMAVAVVALLAMLLSVVIVMPTTPAG